MQRESLGRNSSFGRAGQKSGYRPSAMSAWNRFTPFLTTRVLTVWICVRGSKSTRTGGNKRRFFLWVLVYHSQRMLRIANTEETINLVHGTKKRATRMPPATGLPVHQGTEKLEVES